MSDSVKEQTPELRWWEQLAENAMPWLFAIILTAGMTLVLAVNRSGTSAVNAVAGQPVPDDILAPRSITYTSDVLTDQAKEQAGNTVSEVYTPLDLSIGRAQLSWARAVFAFVETVRADGQATKETKLSYLQSITGLTMETQVGEDLLNLTQADYEFAKSNILTIINELMRQDIREDQLRDYRKTARGEASLELTPTQENVVTNLAPQFIVATVFPDPTETAAVRQEAIDAVEPVVRTITKDRLIVRAGDIVSDADVELLTVLGLLQPATDWRDTGSLFMASLLSVVLLTLYWQQFHSWQLRRGNGRYLTSLAIIVLIFTLIGRLMGGVSVTLLYWFPIAAMSMLLAVIFDVRLSMLATIIVATLVGFTSGGSLELTVYIAGGGVLALMLLQNAYTQRVNAFFRAGLIAALGHIVVIITFRLPVAVDVVEILQLVLYGLGNGILSAALTMVGFFIMGSIFGLTTTLQLQELSRLDHPLLKELLRKAPGTYHHSIMVANLAEQAAERVQANGALVRVGAFYHDIGKMKRPAFFTENQEGDSNPHDALDPESSARIILSHVADGVELAKRYRLPDRVRDFIAEHHGQRVVKSFYRKALAMAEEEGETAVDITQFCHPGPRPRSRESGIVMLADAIEATSSALRPDTVKGIEKLVNSIVDEDLTDGQLDDSGLTLGDIKHIRASFIETLKGRFHVRVKYPGNEALVDPEAANGTELAPSVTETAVPTVPPPVSNLAEESLPTPEPETS